MLSGHSGILLLTPVERKNIFFSLLFFSEHLSVHRGMVLPRLHARGPLDRALDRCSSRRLVAARLAASMTAALDAVVGALGLTAGCGIAGCVQQCALGPGRAAGRATGAPPQLAGRAALGVLALAAAAGGGVGLRWCLLVPPLFAVRVAGPPEGWRNDPAASVWFGQGCFWHTQYDFWLLETDPRGPFRRSAAAATALVGYAGGAYTSAGGSVCYHGDPSTNYARLGHAEAVSVALDANASAARVQLAALASAYFEHGFETVAAGRQRLDPLDEGAEYRNVIGLPGGTDNADWWVAVEEANAHAMPLLPGTVGGDARGEYVVYIYDSDAFPFFRGEDEHQHHTNDVVGRPVPEAYTGAAKQAQRAAGRLGPTGCLGFAHLGTLSALCFGVLLGGGATQLATLLCLICAWRRPEGGAGRPRGAGYQADAGASSVHL
jgi:peptide methionine sulfoxide reductase MsrA